MVCGEGIARRRGVINGELPRIQRPASSLDAGSRGGLGSLQDHCSHEVLQMPTLPSRSRSAGRTIIIIPPAVPTHCGSSLWSTFADVIDRIKDG